MLQKTKQTGSFKLTTFPTQSASRLICQERFASDRSGEMKDFINIYREEPLSSNVGKFNMLKYKLF